ncbi:MAG: hypothetical protein WC824_15955 [Bacteroidota bacterium]
MDINRSFITEGIEASLCRKSLRESKNKIKPHGKNRWFLYDIDAYYTNAQGEKEMFCTCTPFPKPSRTVKEITEWVKSWKISQFDSLDEGGWPTSNSRLLLEKAMAGEPVCTEEGCPLVETKRQDTTEDFEDTFYSKTDIRDEKG